MRLTDIWPTLLNPLGRTPANAAQLDALRPGASAQPLDAPAAGTKKTSS